MQSKNDFFSKIVSARTAILGGLVAVLIIYAVICILMLFASKDILQSSTKFLAPLYIIAASIVIAVDSIHKMTSEKSIVKSFSLVTLFLGLFVALLWSLMFLEIIPMYETKADSLYSLLSSSSPSVAYKIIASLTSIVAFTFLGSIVMNIKENHNLMALMKYVATGFLGCASLISIICNFTDFSQDPLGIIRAPLFQTISWITAIGLGATAFYLSKTITWENMEFDGAISGPTIKQPENPNDTSLYPKPTVGFLAKSEAPVNPPVETAKPAEPTNPAPHNPPIDTTNPPLV